MGARKDKERHRHHPLEIDRKAKHGVSGHPAQGHLPHDPRRTPHEPPDAGPLNPVGWFPWALTPRVAGGGGLFSGGRTLPTGPYSGVGPKGYARSDQRIFEEVCDRLTEHGEIDVHDVTVEVKDGEVTLEGCVPNRFTKRECEQVAEDVLGVVDVHNRLRLAAESESDGRTSEEPASKS
jgi:hypothetical protein